MKKSFLAVLLLGIAALSPVTADTLSNKEGYYLAPFGTYLEPSGASQGSGGYGVGLGLGKILNEHFNVELRGFWQNYHNKFHCCGGGETDLIGATADLQYYFFRDRFSPYAVAGVGGMINNITGPALNDFSKESFIFEGGVGSSYSVSKSFILRGDVRYRLNALPNSPVLNDALFNLGFVIPVSF